MSIISTYTRICEKLMQPLAKTGISPSAITLVSLALGAGAGFFLWKGRFFAALIMLFLAGITDSFDGALARISGRTTKFGAVLDSTVDRVVEFAIIGGIFLYLCDANPAICKTAGIMALTAYATSVWVSYVKARAEGVGVSPAVGILQRRGRIVLTVLAVTGAGIFNQYVEKIFVYYMGTLSAGCIITVAQRMAATKKMLNRR